MKRNSLNINYLMVLKREKRGLFIVYNEKGKRESSLTSMQSRRTRLVSLVLFDQIDRKGMS